jgi:hypothetical protein
VLTKAAGGGWGGVRWGEGEGEGVGGGSCLYGCALLVARRRLCARCNDAAVARASDCIEGAGAQVEAQRARLPRYVPHAHAAVEAAADYVVAVAIERDGVHGANVPPQLTHHGPCLRGGGRGGG